MWVHKNVDLNYSIPTFYITPEKGFNSEILFIWEVCVIALQCTW